MAKTDITAINAQTISVKGVPIAGSGPATGPFTTFDQIDADAALALKGVVIRGVLPAGASFTNFTDLNVLSGVSVDEVIQYGSLANDGSGMGIPANALLARNDNTPFISRIDGTTLISRIA